VGAKVSVTVRPEKIELRKTSSTVANAGENLLPGRVVRVVYIGTDTHYDVDLGGMDLRVREQNSYSGSSRIAAEGDSVVVAFDPSVARVLAQ
jgi:spermidine/putrescine transport system ATP-binding protein